MSATISIGSLFAVLGVAAKSFRPVRTQLQRFARERLSDAVSSKLAAPREEVSIPSPHLALEEYRHAVTEVARALRAEGKLAPLDVEKAAAIAAIGRAPVIAKRPEAVEAVMNTVSSCGTLPEVHSARRQLEDVLRAEHGRAWISTLADETQRAFDAIGFSTLEVVERSDREIHLAGVNGDGKVLVSEIRLKNDGTSSLAAEVVNGAGKDCEAILARFEAALGQSVRGSAAVKKPTGGVCELGAATEFVRKHARANSAATRSGNVRRTAAKKKVLQQRQS